MWCSQVYVIKGLERIYNKESIKKTLTSKMLYENKRKSFKRETMNLQKYIQKIEDDIKRFGDPSLDLHGTMTVAQSYTHESTLRRKVKLLNKYL